MEDAGHGPAVWVRLVGMNLRRSIVVVVLLTALATLLSVSPWHVDASTPAATGSATTPDPTSRALDVLRRWDASRAAAWAAGDVAALRALYRPESVAGASDVWRLQQYVDRGLVVDGMRTQVLSAELTRWARRRVTLVVTDRLAVAEAVDSTGGRHRLPRDLASTTTVTLVRHRGDWQVA